VRRLFLILALVAGDAPAASASEAASAPEAASAYPPARRGDVVDIFHGVEVRDPYRWMEDLRSPELAAWIEAQNTLSEPQLRGGAVHAEAISRMKALTDLYPKQELPQLAGGQGFYRAMVDDRIVLMVQGPGDPMPRTLVDAEALGKDGAVKTFLPSSDGRRVAYVVGPRGADWGEIRIRDVASNRELPVVLPNVRHGGPMAWSADGGGLVYQRYAPPRDGRREAQAEDPAVYLHRLGATVDEDLRLFALPDDRRDWALDFDLPGDRQRLVAYVERGPWHDGNLGGSRTQVHVLALDASGRPREGARPLALTEPDAAYRVVHVEANRALVFTDKDAPRRRLVSMDLDKKELPASWRNVLPEGKGVLTEARWIGGKLVTHSTEDVKSAVRVYDAYGRLLRTVPLPGTGIVEEVLGQAESRELVLLYSGLLQAPAFIRHDLGSGRTSVEVVSDAAPDLSAFEVSQEWFASKDGTRVPMFILARKGLVRDGSHPTILYGYGASSSSELPTLRADAAAWVQMGGVYAIANPRGGGEFGRAWYEAAIRERKQTTFDDMIAAAGHLIASGRTSPRRLGIHGGSNGGLLVTAVMLQRPDLFGAVMADVPVTDAMRRHLAGNGVQQVEQWGSPDDRAVFPALRAYSPVHNVVPGTCYPPTLITTSHDDERLPAWHAYKFAAALQAGQGCAAPILLRSRTSGGHGGGGQSSWVDNTAARLTFAARHLGLEAPSRAARATQD
jgi:prolyl oligopeptidase